MIIKVEWTKEDIAQKRPDWGDDKCWRFLEYIKSEVIAAAESAGNEVIDRVLGTGVKES